MSHECLSAAVAVRLQLLVQIKQGDGLFQAMVRTAGGHEVWNQTGLHTSTPGGSRTIELVVPASVLPNDEYDVILQGQRQGGRWEDLETYHFGVVR